MAVKKKSATTIRIDLLPELHEQPKGKQVRGPGGIPRKKPPAEAAPGPLWGRDFQELFQSVYDGVVITRADGGIVDANQRALHFYRYEREPLRRMGILDLISCSSAQLLETILDTLNEEKYVLIEAYSRRSDASVFPSEISVNRIMLAGQPHLCFLVRDTTQRENAERLRRQMQFIINRSHAVAFRVTADEDLGIAYISDSVGRYGFEAAALMDGGHRLLDFLHPEDARGAAADILRSAHEGEGDVELECRVVTASGETRWIHLQAWSVREEDGPVLFCQGVFMDISERKHIEEERALMEIRLRQAQKLEAMGQLAAGIAHEINSPTQFVGDSIHFLQSACHSLGELIAAYEDGLERMGEVSPGEEKLAAIGELRARMDYEFLREEIPRALDRSLKGIRRIADIVLAMKEFSHPGDSERSLVDVNKTIEHALIVAKNEWKYAAEVEKELDESLPLLRCIPGEINQVILNILVNAAQAIAELQDRSGSGKGRILIRTRRKGEAIRIDIQDSGAGIPEAVKGRVFDPFFTTKEVGKGTGQGLAIAYNIVVHRHGGRLWCSSPPEGGAVFHVVLPLMMPPPDVDGEQAVHGSAFVMSQDETHGAAS